MKLVYTNHAIKRGLVRLFDRKEDEIVLKDMVDMKLMLDKLIIPNGTKTKFGNGVQLYLKIDSFDGFVAVCIIEGDSIVVKTISPTTKG